MGHDALRNCIVEALPGLADAEADLRVVTYWSAIYGYATMRKKGVIHTNSSRLVSLDFSEAVVERVAAVAAGMADAGVQRIDRVESAEMLGLFRARVIEMADIMLGRIARAA
ncbi:hypothetical protein E4T56_gene9970, partial [Termitomyces sp. T112]